MPRTLSGSRPSVVVSDLQQFQVSKKDSAGIFENMYAATADSQLRTQGKETFEAAKMIESLDRSPYVPANGAQYVGEFGRGLQQIARLIKANVGVEAAFADIALDWAVKQRKWFTGRHPSRIRRLPRGIYERHGRSNGGYRSGNDVGVWPDCRRRR